MSQAPVYRRVPIGAGTLTIYAGLHYIRGNPAPYFTLTAEAKEYGRGMQHDLILEQCPDLAPLADLHLSDINGVPLHAVENGWYWLEGAAGGWGSRLHGAQHPGVEPEKCLRILAQHLRLSNREAQNLLSITDRTVQRNGLIAAKQGFAWYVESLKERWKAEAEEAIEHFNLQIFGDFWPGFQAAV